MKDKFLMLLASIFLFVVATMVIYIDAYNDCKEEVQRLGQNEQVLLSNVERYKVRDSLNAAKVGILTLDLEQYKQYRADDLRIINDMGIKCKNLQSAYAAQTETIRQIQGNVRDSLVYVDRLIIDTLRCVRIEDKWLSLDICINDNGTYKGEISMRDSLIIVSEVKYKRFLGFLWRTNKIKSRKMHIISKNPSTKIEGFEYIELH